MADSQTYPLVFTFPDTIVGAGFVARVELRGLAVLVIEGDGDHWIYGVQPGAVAGGGNDVTSACREFKRHYRSIVFQFAAEAKDYADFASNVRAFFGAANKPNRADWNAALQHVRAGHASLEGFARTEAPVHLPSLEVFELRQDRMRPEMNQFDDVAAAA